MDRKEAGVMAKLACAALEEKKAIDVKVIDIHQVSVMADYFIICAAGNPNQVQAMVDQVEENMEKSGYALKYTEGGRNSEWILMDFGDVVLHIFNEESRQFYDLERIWKDGAPVDAETL